TRRRSSRFHMPARHAVGAAVALVLLNGSLTFTNVWPTPKIRWGWALSVELAVVVLALVLAGRWRNALAGRVLPVLWIVLVIGRYLAVTGPGLYGRDFNIYWDSQHIGNVTAMLARAVPAWALVAGVAAGVLALAGLFVAIRAAFRQVDRLIEFPVARPLVAGVAAVVLALFFVVPRPPASDALLRYADPVTPVFARQVRFALALAGPGVTIPPSPAVLNEEVPALGGADLLVIFVESYGAVTYDRPAFAEALAASREGLATAARDTGRRVLSAFVDPPTFGASSWLSHLSFMTGLEVRDQYTYTAVMASDRDTLARAFRRRGYRSVALMPGMRQPWPEGAFYGFDEIYGRAALDYRGPQFGWWSIPDQYALAKLDALERTREGRAPLFAFFPTSTTHAPFGPVPPYQPDWARVLTPEPFEPADADAAIAARPDLTDLAPSYLRATAYEFEVFAGYLREHAGDDLVLVLIGDHQPPSAVSGPGAPWDVPVHIVARQPAILAALERAGFRDGMTPARPAVGTMSGLTAALMRALGGSDE
ncbi:MAG: sulfatase-like hydrolase/transferase, partial [Vicinamibacteria bacterium]